MTEKKPLHITPDLVTDGDFSLRFDGLGAVAGSVRESEAENEGLRAKLIRDLDARLSQGVHDIRDIGIAIETLFPARAFIEGSKMTIHTINLSDADLRSIAQWIDYRLEIGVDEMRGVTSVEIVQQQPGYVTEFTCSVRVVDEKAKPFSPPTPPRADSDR